MLLEDAPGTGNACGTRGLLCALTRATAREMLGGVYKVPPEEARWRLAEARHLLE